MDGPKVNFDYGPGMSPFMNDVMRTIIQQDDSTGIGGHGPMDHGNHGLHSQTSIGLGDATINFRELLK